MKNSVFWDVTPYNLIPGKCSFHFSINFKPVLNDVYVRHTNKGLYCFLLLWWAGIATRYGLDDPVIESRWGRDFSHPSWPGLGPTQPPVQWVSDTLFLFCAREMQTSYRPFYLRCILSYLLRLYLTRCLFSVAFRTKTLIWISLHSRTFHVPRSLSLLDFITLIILGEHNKSWSSAIFSFSDPPVTVCLF